MFNELVVLKDKDIRRILHNNEWWFAVEDVVAELVDSSDTRQYIKRMRQCDPALNSSWATICTPLTLSAPDGKICKTDCANREGLFRIIQSIATPKAEPFKRWLAKVAFERLQEIEDPELATKRTKSLSRAKGYSETWIEKRWWGIAVRAELTDEWHRCGVIEDSECDMLAAEISKATFGLTTPEYKKLKGLERENLRDHMTDLELIFSMLGEAATTEIARKQDAQGFGENKVAAGKGGKISGYAREKLEIETGNKVVSPENYLEEPESRKRLKDKNK